MSCGIGAKFFTCGKEGFFGCCKTNPCTQDGGCRDGDLVPAFMERPDQHLFGDASINNLTVPPVTTSSVALASEPAMTSAPVYNGPGFGRTDAITSASISIAVMVMLCALVALLLGWKRLYSRGRHTYVPVEQYAKVDRLKLVC
jgi:hypothetical protein